MQSTTVILYSIIFVLLAIIAFLCISLMSVMGQTVIFHESFDKNDDPEMGNTGGNDNKWSGDIANSYALLTDNEGWKLNYASGAFKCAKLGTSKYAGYAVTPEIHCTGNVVLTFKAAAWGEDKDTTLLLNINGGTADKYSFPIPRNKWGEYKVAISDISEKITVRFSSLEKRFFLDEVKVSLPNPDDAAIYVTTGTLVDFGFVGHDNSGGTRNINVVGVNLSGSISAAITDDAGKVFSVTPATLASEGGQLQASFNTQKTGMHTATLVLKGTDASNPSNIIEKKLQLGVEVSELDLQGGGSKENPYTVSDAITVYNNNPWNDQYWVKGYVLGAVGADSNNVLSYISATGHTSLVLGNSADETDITKTVTVELVSGGAARAALNVDDNPDIIGMCVMVRGTLDKAYYGVAGVKGVKTEEQYVILGKAQSALTDIESADIDAPMYDLLGRRVNAGYKGIVIQNGRKILLR